MSVNVVLTRLEESGSAACEIHMQVFVEMCHNTRSLCVCMFACHIQSELGRVDVSVTGVGAQERVVSLGVQQQVAAEMCVRFWGGWGGGERGGHLPASNKSPM